MSGKPRMRAVKRIRRKLWGGLVDIRIYPDGSVRARCDHPSNDPEIEMAMAGRVVALARELYPKYGLGVPVMQPVVWRDDPPKART